MFMPSDVARFGHNALLAGFAAFASGVVGV